MVHPTSVYTDAQEALSATREYWQRVQASLRDNHSAVPLLWFTTTKLDPPVPLRRVPVKRSELMAVFRRHGIWLRHQSLRGHFEPLGTLSALVHDPIDWTDFGLTEVEVTSWVTRHGAKLYQQFQRSQRSYLARQIFDLPLLNNHEWNAVLGNGASIELAQSVIRWLEAEHAWLKQAIPRSPAARQRLEVFNHWMQVHARAEMMIAQERPPGYDHPAGCIYRSLSFGWDDFVALLHRHGL